MAEAQAPKPRAAALIKERVAFKRNLAANLNYFGNLEESELPVVKKIVANTTFEELTCVSFNPETDLLEATIAVKLPTGYNGDLCQAGSTEYVRFFLDYGAGWEDAGLAGVRVHDIPTGRDCERKPDKPLIYVATLKLDPRRKCCFDQVLPRVHAILSWQLLPPPGAANVNWNPVWGNSLDCAIQIKPSPWSFWCLIEFLRRSEPQVIELPKFLEPVQLHPIPLPDPPPFELAQLVEAYGGTPASGKSKKKAAPAVEPHRFGLPDIHAAALAPAAFDTELFETTAAKWTALGLDLQAAINALADTSANVAYEELECLGLDEAAPERLIATFRIKRSTGYSGPLCHAGSTEYVAFWADWDDTCEWTYLGTAQVNVHDLSEIPAGGLCYAAILPVDLTYHRRSCDRPKIARVRAVLSWGVPPSTTDPDALNYWGNRIDSHVQIEPGDEIPPGGILAKIRNLGGIPIEDIATGGNGLTNPGTSPHVVFAHHHWARADALGRACPFGGIIEVEGYFFPGYYYRVKRHLAGEPATTFTVLGDSFWLQRWDVGFDQQIATGGWFAYPNPALYLDRLLAVWHSGGDDLLAFQLDIATAPNDMSIVASSPWYRLQLDNTRPVEPTTMDIHIDQGGDCKTFDEGLGITGTFLAQDAYFGSWSLSTEPDTATTPSNDPTAILSSTAPASGDPWQLNTTSPKVMKPCGYIVRLSVSDRSILHSIPGQHNSNHMSVGFCLRET